MMDQPGPMTVLINPYGGRGRDPRAMAELQQLIAARLPDATVEVVRRGESLTERARVGCAAGARVVAVAGGDGSLNAVAQTLVGTDVRLGIVPFGTFNHFAHDVEIPLDLSEAVDLLAGETVRRIDVGAVNDRYFLNNASLGVYPELVKLREHESRALSKPLRLGKATWKIARTAKPLRVQIEHAGRTTHVRVWLIFVGNNFYHLGIFSGRYRTRLDAGQLDVFELRARRRVGIIRLLLRTLRHHFHTHSLVHRELATLTVRPAHPQGRCAVAMDGEVVDMPGPFIFRSVPQALQILAPPAP